MHKANGGAKVAFLVKELFFEFKKGVGIKRKMGFLKTSFLFCAIIYSSVFLTACSKPEKEKPPEFLIKTTAMMISAEDFSEELDLKKAAYPYNISENPEEYNEMVIYLVKMLSEEIVLLNAAADKGITVTDQEVQSAEDELKKDYPENSFDQMLLENAISYSLWEKRFKKNMIIDKLIDQELRKKIEITSQDIVEFYKKNKDAQNHDPDNKTFENEKELVSRLRMQKAQDHYDEWMQQLEQNYPVEVNNEKLKTFLIDTEKSEGSKNEKQN